ncbi:hypothetical protein J6TS2_51040 [Heyndrickxia sporothermodurans]|nr:hypothetical protein J6TS2_51040 [Heyndrickxia sporothermodurans]
MKLVSKIGEKIKESGLRDDYIADRMQISKKQVYNLKKGISFPTFEKAFILASILNCPVDELATFEEEGNSKDN